MKFGDYVRAQVRGGPVDFGYVIGVPEYSHGFDDVVMIADAKYDGMPINACWCESAGDGSEFKARRLRERYESKYPGALAAESEKDA